MRTIAFFDTKPYDQEFFDTIKSDYEFRFFENKLNEDTAVMAKGCDGVCVFVNDDVNAKVIDILYGMGIRIIAMRSAGYNNVDVKAAYRKIHIVRVPSYSPNAVAEHAMALLLSLNRKIHKAYNRTRDFNFSLSGLMGFDMAGKTIGVIGTGRIGQMMIDICRGFAMNVLAYDIFPSPGEGIRYVSFDELMHESDIITLHVPLTDETRHMINSEVIAKMKDGVYIINTSRGGLIESKALLSALKSGKVAGAGLDVYEEESDLFFEDLSSRIIEDDVLSLLLSLPNVIITSHQGFFTKEALREIARTTIENLDSFFSGKPLVNEVCYLCKDKKSKDCLQERTDRCF